MNTLHISASTNLRLLSLKQDIKPNEASLVTYKIAKFEYESHSNSKTLTFLIVVIAISAVLVHRIQPCRSCLLSTDTETQMQGTSLLARFSFFLFLFLLFWAFSLSSSRLSHFHRFFLFLFFLADFWTGFLCDWCRHWFRTFNCHLCKGKIHWQS